MPAHVLVTENKGNSSQFIIKLTLTSLFCAQEIEIKRHKERFPKLCHTSSRKSSHLFVYSFVPWALAYYFSCSVIFFICKRSMFVEYPVTNRLVTLLRRSDYAYGHSRRPQPAIDIFVMLSLSSVCGWHVLWRVQKQTILSLTTWTALFSPLCDKARTHSSCLRPHQPPELPIFIFPVKVTTDPHVHDLFLYGFKAYKAVYMYDCVELKLSLYHWFLSLVVLFGSKWHEDFLKAALCKI